MTAFVPPSGTRLEASLSPRIARVRTLDSLEEGARVLYCKRVLPAHLGLSEAADLLVRETHILNAIASSDAASLVPRVVRAGDDAAGPYVLLEAFPMAYCTLAPPRNLDAATCGAWLERTFAPLARLHAATREGVRLDLVHGDLSPDNVLCTNTDAVFLDWELGRMRGLADLALGPFRGTLAFVAPEVAAGERPTQRSDVFALALSCLSLLCDRPIRKHTGAAGILEAAMEPIEVERVAPPWLRAHRSLRSFFEATLAHRPNERPEGGAAALAHL